MFIKVHIKRSQVPEEMVINTDAMQTLCPLYGQPNSTHIVFLSGDDIAVIEPIDTIMMKIAAEG